MRLSKRQKWILIECFKNKYKTINYYYVYKNYHNLKTVDKYSSRIIPPRSTRISVTRSIKRLVDCGLMDKTKYKRLYQLTDNGMNKAQELL